MDRHASLVWHVGVSHNCQAHDTPHISFNALCVNAPLQASGLPPSISDMLTVWMDQMKHSCSTYPPTFKTYMYGENVCSTGQGGSWKEVESEESTAGARLNHSRWHYIARYRPSSNIKLAANVFKCRFLKAYSFWVKDNFHPVLPATRATSFCRSSPFHVDT